jgi:hypothetical protein
MSSEQQDQEQLHNLRILFNKKVPNKVPIYKTIELAAAVS